MNELLEKMVNDKTLEIKNDSNTLFKLSDNVVAMLSNDNINYYIKVFDDCINFKKYIKKYLILNKIVSYGYRIITLVLAFNLALSIKNKTYYFVLGILLIIIADMLYLHKILKEIKEQKEMLQCVEENLNNIAYLVACKTILNNKKTEDEKNVRDQ